MLNAYQYGTYVNEYDADPRHSQPGITYSDEVLEHYKNHDDPVNYPDTNWWDEVAKDWAGKPSIACLSVEVRTRCHLYFCPIYVAGCYL